MKFNQSDEEIIVNKPYEFSLMSMAGILYLNSSKDNFSKIAEILGEIGIVGIAIEIIFIISYLVICY